MTVERRRLLPERRGYTKRIVLRHSAGMLKVYVTTSAFLDGGLAELFVKADKSGSTISGLLDALSITTSLALQYGVPLETIVEKWTRMNFAPSGSTDDKDMPRVSSIVDAIARWLRRRYLPPEGSGAP